MNPDPTEGRVHAHWLAATLVAATFVGICLGPHLVRLRHPSLFTDDVTRISDLQAKPLEVLLFRPIQEHMAPLFEVVSWVTWRLAGRRLSNAPLAFNLVSYVPFVLSLWMLGLLLYRELGSLTTALVAVATYSLSSLHAEAVYWYSASSFFWALSWTLVTLHCAGAATRAGGRYRLSWAALAAALAPACSAIGLLAGPLGAIRVGATTDREGRRGIRGAAIVPLLGTLLHLAVCSAFRYRDVLASSIEHRADFASGLSYVICAPTNVLVPGLFGLGYVDLWPLAGLNVGLSILGLVGVLGWARRSPHRALILGGLWLVLGGYTMTYCFRTHRFGTHWLFEVGRYHVFPLLGFVLWLAPASRPWLSRYDRRPVGSLVVATVAAALLMVIHLPSLLIHSRFYQFPNQHRTLAALERLDGICRRERITRDQVLAALDPFWPRWSHVNILALLPASVRMPEVSDRLVHRTLLAALLPAEREALWGGMDASPYLRPAEDWEAGAPAVAVGRLIGSYRVRTAGAGRYVPAGWPSYLEFEMPDRAPGIAHQAFRDCPATRALCVPGGSPGCLMEVWWTGKDGGWSETRSVRWRPDAARPTRAWAVSLDRLPHWDAAHAQRIRIVFRTAGQTTVGAPRLLR